MSEQNAQNNATKPLTRYERELAVAMAAAKPIYISPKQQMNILEQLHEGMDEFVRSEKKMRGEAELEMRKIILD